MLKIITISNGVKHVEDKTLSFTWIMISIINKFGNDLFQVEETMETYPWDVPFEMDLIDIRY